MNENIKQGSCLCGGVAYRLEGPLRPVIACHCTQCRKTSGHHVAATSVPLDRFALTAQDTLVWYRSSDFAERGFCSRCGSNLFWQRDGADEISIFAGSLDAPTGLTLEQHIFCADAGDYYTIDDGKPQLPAGRPRPADAT